MVLVDGKQRLLAVRRFLADEIRAFGKLYSEYGPLSGTRTNGMIKFNVNDLETRAEVLDWYLSLNAGGTAHQPEEIERVKNLLKIEVDGPKAETRPQHPRRPTP
jgi:hypothetical protein